MASNGPTWNEYVKNMLTKLFGQDASHANSKPEGLVIEVIDLPEWTMQPRSSDYVRTNGYPFGYAKSLWHLRDRLATGFGEQLQFLSSTEKNHLLRVHEAMARALDSERVLGSFNYDNYCERDHFPLQTVDLVADNLITWLDHQGFRIVPKEKGKPETPLPEVERRSPNAFHPGIGAVMSFTEKERSGLDASSMISDKPGEADAIGAQPDSLNWDALNAEERTERTSTAFADPNDDEDDKTEEEPDDDEDFDRYDEDDLLWYTEGYASEQKRSPTLLYLDPHSGLVLDKDAHATICKHVEEGVDDGEVSFNFNSGAGGFSALGLSELQPGEDSPPVGDVGQYGRFGCLVEDGVEGWTGDSYTEVMLYAYEEGGLEAFVRELEVTGEVLFRRAKIDAGDWSSFAADFLYDPSSYDDAETGAEDELGDENDDTVLNDEEEADEGLDRHAARAVAWGRNHAIRLETGR